MYIKKRFVFIIFLIMAYLIPVSAGAGDLAPSGNLDSGLYQTADGDITAGEGTCIIRPGRDVVFAAGEEIRLTAGFHARDGSEFQGLITNTDDADTDGIPDWWEALYKLDNPGDDPDGDGLSNLEEFNAQTDPTVYNPPLPVISFIAVPDTIVEGSSAELRWTVSGAASISIDPEPTPVPGSNHFVSQGAVSPTTTQTYTLTAANAQGKSSTATTTVTVQHHKPIVTFSASPIVVSTGQTSTLTWQSTYAVSVSIDNGIGSVTSSGSKDVAPSGSTIYTITATGPGGTTQASVRVSDATDTDGDGIPDDWELQHLNTLTYDIDDDPDGDGLTNYEEFRIGSDPLAYGNDNDGDGLKDHWELTYFGNLAQDADGDYDNDGVDNLAEQIIKTNPADAADYPLPGNYYEYDAVGRIKRIIRIN